MTAPIKPAPAKQPATPPASPNGTDAKLPNLTTAVPPSMQMLPGMPSGPAAPISLAAAEQIFGYANRRTRYHGLVYDDDVVAELRGYQARKTLARMSMDDVIAGIVSRTSLIMRSAKWTIRPGGKDDIDLAFAAHIKDGIERLDGGWQTTVGSASSMLVWGFWLAEQIFERQPNGLYNWRAFLPRDQRTVLDWTIEPQTGELIDVLQQTDDGYSARLPMWKLLHFRTEPIAGRPEGRPLIRNCYLPWIDKQELRRIIKIGVKRDMVGLPLAKVPPEMLTPSATPEMLATLAVVETALEQLENDERQYLIWPSDTDEQGQPSGWSFELVKSPGSRALKLEELMGMHNRAIALALMSEVVLLGLENVGSRALGDVKTDTLARAMSAWLDDIAEWMRTFGCRTQRLLNPKFADAQAPIFEHGSLNGMTLDELGNFIQKCGVGGFLTADDALEAELRRRAELPNLVVTGERGSRGAQPSKPGEPGAPEKKPAAGKDPGSNAEETSI